MAHLFYLPVAALASTGGVKRGILAGAIAVALFTLGVIINPNISPSELLTLSTPLRFLTYATMGGLLGWFSARDRELVERLRLLAERDFLTGLPNTRAFEAAIARRFEAGIPFALLLGDMNGLRRSMTRRGTRRATTHCGASRSCSGHHFARRTRSPGSAATSSPSSRFSDGPTRPRLSPRSSRARWRARTAGSRSAVRSSGGRRERALALPGSRRASLRAEARARPASWPQPLYRRRLAA